MWISLNNNCLKIKAQNTDSFYVDLYLRSFQSRISDSYFVSFNVRSLKDVGDQDSPQLSFFYYL